MKKKVVAVFLVIGMIFTMTACQANKTSDDIQTEYKKVDEWRASFFVPEYRPNNEITGSYDKSLAADCENGTFVGQMEEDVISWKGIPYAKQPVGELRFKRAEAPEASDKVYEAFYFGKTCMQDLSESERASFYEQGEDCLCLNVWNSTSNTKKNKPILVYIHGGGWCSGGTCDPLYDGYNFAHYNPDVIVVTIAYRMNGMGLINLSSFPDGAEYEGSMNNALLDMTQALKWIKNNAAAFGGDANNITISGESAGGAAVSLLCVLPEAKGLFQKAIPMSGSCSQANNISVTEKLPEALRNEFGVQTVADIQNIPFEDFRWWWVINYSDFYHHVVRDGNVLPLDPFEAWSKGDTKDITILQGHTGNEFAYYKKVLGTEDIYDSYCDVVATSAYNNGSEEYKKEYDKYMNALRELGYPEESLNREFMNDFALAIGNTYQATKHAENGGKGYCYTFEEEYDGTLASSGAAHAVDCYYLFGNFDGRNALGTNDEVDLSRKFQKMIANFCKTGDPSIDGVKWPEYNTKTRQKMIIEDKPHVEENPEKNRVESALKMLELSGDNKYSKSISVNLPKAIENNPQAYEKLIINKILDFVL